MAYSRKVKVVVITGAAGGIGALVVRMIMDEDVKHVAVLDVNDKAGIDLQNELNAKYGANRVKFIKCDITDEDVFIRGIESVAQAKRRLDVLINNAGIMNDSLKSYKKMIEINVTALITGTLKAIDIMSKENGGSGGTVINVASIAALIRTPLFPIYLCTKSAVLQFSNCVGMDEYYSRTGVRVLTICFGVTDTPILHANNFGCFDKKIEAIAPEGLKKFTMQKPESAAQGLVDMYLQAKSGSTWIATSDKPAKDISATVKKAYDLLTYHVFELKK